MLKEHDKLAVEGMARTGIELEELYKLFPLFDNEDIRDIYTHVKKHTEHVELEPDIKCCGQDVW